MQTKNKILRFKTNINCSGCVSQIGPFFNKAKEIYHWDIDLNSDDKILIVSSSKITPDKVIQLVKKSGFKASLIN